MNKDQKKMLGMFIIGMVVMVGIIGFQFMQSGKIAHDPTDTMDGTISMVMEEEEMMENKTDDMALEEMMDKDDEMKSEEMMNDGPMAPTFALMDLDGNTVDLAGLKGEKVYVKFWASWCPICLSGLDEMDTLAGEMNDFKVITVVAPGYNGELKEDEFKEWFKTRGTENMTVLLDDGGQITKQFGVRGYPTSVFIGSDGVLVQQFPGHVGAEQIKTFFSEEVK